MATKPIDTEKYQGPGRITAAAGDAKIWGIVGSILGIPAGMAGASIVKPDGKAGRFIQGVAEIFEGGHSSRLRKMLGTAHSSKGMLKVAGAIVGFTVMGSVGLLVGFVHGWGKGNRGEEQFNLIKAERDEARETVAAMQTQIVGLQSEVTTHRKKFTDHVSTKAEHASHAEAVHHEKEHANHLELA